MGTGERPPLAFRECRGPRGCRNAADTDPAFAQEVAAILARAGFAVDPATDAGGGAARTHGRTSLKVAIAWCPNGCSMPQIADLGIVALRPVEPLPDVCTGCGACLAACAERALTVAAGRAPVIDRASCVDCGLCARACPAGALVSPRVAFRLLFGGRLGRHPRLAEPCPRLFDRTGALAHVARAAELLAGAAGTYRRLADLLGDERTRARLFA